MWLERLKQVASGKRSSNRWTYLGTPHNYLEDPARKYQFYMTKSEGELLETAINCFEELVAVAEAAIDLTKSGAIRGCAAEVDLENAIAALRQKVEGEGG